MAGYRSVSVLRGCLMMYKSDSWEGGDDLVFKNTSIIVSIASMGKWVRLLAVVAFGWTCFVIPAFGPFSLLAY